MQPVWIEPVPVGHFPKIQGKNREFPQFCAHLTRQRAMPVTFEDAAQAIKDAEHIAFVFPLWLGTASEYSENRIPLFQSHALAFAPDTGNSRQQLQAACQASAMAA